MQAKVEFVVPNVVPISISFLSLYQRIKKDNNLCQP